MHNILTVVRFGIDYDLGRRNGHMAGLDSGASALVLATVVRPHPRYHEHGSFPETRLYHHRDVSYATMSIQTRSGVSVFPII